MPTALHRPRAVNAALLVGALALLTAAVPRCSGPAERTTAPSIPALPLAQRGPCLHACAEARADQILLENQRHRAAMAACNEDADCLLEEAVLHDAVLAEITADFGACQEACR
jgi:hypothetical protein